MAGTVARHAPESWTGMARNWWPAWAGIRNHDPMGLHEQRLAAAEIDRPKAVLGVAEEGEPRGTARAGPVVFGEHPPDDVLVDIETESVRKLLRDAPAAEARIALFHRDDGGHELGRRALGAREAAPLRQEQQPVLAFHECAVKRQ